MNHEHAMVKEVIPGSTLGTGQSKEIEHCKTCTSTMEAQGSSPWHHASHPTGCRCYMCIDCRCEALLKREAEDSPV